MHNFVEKIIKFKWFIAILIPVIAITMSLQLKHLAFEGSYRIWFDKDSQILKNYDNFRDIFGNDQAITITFKNEDTVFNKDSLGVVKRITEKFWQTEYITRVDSITNYQYVYSDPEYPDEIIVEDFIEDIDSLDKKTLEEKQKIILKEDAIVKRLISEDAKTTTIVARLSPQAGESPEVSLKLKKLTEEIVKPEIQKYGYKFYLNGGPIVNSAFIEIAQADGALFTPLTILITMILLLFIFKKFSSMIASITIVICTILIVLAIQIMLGYKLNNFTVNMPVFITAIGIADAMHILWIYKVARKKGMDNEKAIHYSVRKNFLPILFTSLTTAVGFASLSISNVIPIKTLGIATANAALLAFILTIIFIPAILAIVNPKIKAEDDTKNKSTKFAKWYGAFIVKFDKKIFISTLLLFIAIAYGITKVQVDSNTVRYFKEDVPWRQTVNFIQDNISGPMTYEIIVDSKKKDGVKDPKFLRDVEKFYKEFYKAFPNEVRHIGSLLDVIKKFNEVMNNSKTVPNSQNLVAQYLLLYTLSLPQGMEINDQMDIEERQFRITASTNVTDTSKDLEMLSWVENWWKTNTQFSARVDGQTAMFAHMQHDVSDTLIKSITIAIIAVSFMMLLIFRNVRLLPLFVLPNIIPIALVVGIMGWLDIDIDIGVAIAGAIIIGVAVDDTIHFLVKYFEARNKGANIQDSLTYVMQYAGNAIIFTTIILSIAFSIFVFSDFLPNYMFGVVTASALIIAVIADLLMLPAILSMIDTYKTKRRRVK
ncbi:MAG: MMPL family transporter [Arcobacter sp.]|nr:MMPL family transporter [Arcobacter sp.]